MVGGHLGLWIERVPYFPQFGMVKLYGYCYSVTDFLTRCDAAPLPSICAYCIPLFVGEASIVSRVNRQ